MNIGDIIRTPRGNFKINAVFKSMDEAKAQGYERVFTHYEDGKKIEMVFQRYAPDNMNLVKWGIIL